MEVEFVCRGYAGRSSRLRTVNGIYEFYKGDDGLWTVIRPGVAPDTFTETPPRRLSWGWRTLRAAVDGCNLLRGDHSAHPDGKPSVEAWTDGSSWRDGAGAAVVYVDPEAGFESVRAEGRHMPGASNNVAELEAVSRAMLIGALEADRVVVHTDSQYVCGVLGQTMTPTANLDRVTQAVALRRLLGPAVEIVHVRGHHGLPYNEAADAVAGWARATPDAKTYRVATDVARKRLDDLLKSEAP